MMRSTAEAKGRDPKIAEAMVDPYVYIPGIIDSGKVLTFTTSEAVTHGFCDGVANDINKVLEMEGITTYDIKEYHASFIENIIGLLVNPFVSGILIMVIVGGIYFELQTPGVGFPLLAAGIAIILYFAPLYLEGLASNWEIILFVTGLILLAVEIFVLPGFGLAGVGGIVFIAMSLTFSLIGNDGFDFSGVPTINIFQPLLIVISAMILSVGLSYIVGRRFMKTTTFGRLVLKDVQDARQGYSSFDTEQETLLAGKEGLAVTHMRPTGKIRIGEDLFTAISEYSFIDKGETILVTRVEGMNIFVRKSPAKQALD
jgi:membrane-bound serine protease (ClpP class)